MKTFTTILIADDDPSIVSVLARALEHENYNIITASSGEEVLKITSQKKVDLLLLDISLPGVDGIWVTRRLRANEKTRLMPIIIITGHTEKEYKIKGINAGADDFITKPVDLDEVLARVRTSLNLNYYRRQLHEKEELKTLLKEMIDGVIICSSDWTIEEMNNTAKECLGISDLTGTNFLDCIFRDFSVSVSRSELADLSVSHKTFYIIKRGKPSIHLLANLDIFKVPSGEPSSILLDLRNVTSEALY